MEVDYIIVGCGLAGIAFCEQLKTNNKSFIVFDNDSQQSSTVAGGLYNPVVLKRFTGVWRSKEQLELALPVYNKIEKELQEKLDYNVPVYRLFNSIEEQNDWFTASDKPSLTEYLSTNLVPNTNTALKANFGYGEVLQSGRVDTKALIKAYKTDLKAKDLLITEAFNYDFVNDDEFEVNYKTITAKHIVFSEGFGLKQNPYFNFLPLTGSKGELLTIKAPNLKLEEIVKSSVFIIPLGNDIYRVGSTYNWNDKTNTPTPEAKAELLEKLNSFLDCDYEIITHEAGVRPTVADRRPLVGRHSHYKNLYVLNGLGTRGVMIGPYVAKELYNFIENKTELNSEINCNRFRKYTYKPEL